MNWLRKALGALGLTWLAALFLGAEPEEVDSSSPQAPSGPSPLPQVLLDPKEPHLSAEDSVAWTYKPGGQEGAICWCKEVQEWGLPPDTPKVDIGRKCEEGRRQPVAAVVQLEKGVKKEGAAHCQRLPAALLTGFVEPIQLTAPITGARHLSPSGVLAYATGLTGNCLVLEKKITSEGAVTRSREDTHAKSRITFLDVDPHGHNLLVGHENGVLEWHELHPKGAKQVCSTMVWHTSPTKAGSVTERFKRWLWNRFRPKREDQSDPLHDTQHSITACRFSRLSEKGVPQRIVACYKSGIVAVWTCSRLRIHRTLLGSTRLADAARKIFRRATLLRRLYLNQCDGSETAANEAQVSYRANMSTRDSIKGPYVFLYAPANPLPRCSCDNHEVDNDFVIVNTRRGIVNINRIGTGKAGDGAEGRIVSCTVSASGCMVVTGHQNGTVIVWDTHVGTYLQRLTRDVRIKEAAVRVVFASDPYEASGGKAPKGYVVLVAYADRCVCRFVLNSGGAYAAPAAADTPAPTTGQAAQVAGNNLAEIVVDRSSNQPARAATSVPLLNVAAQGNGQLCADRDGFVRRSTPMAEVPTVSPTQTHGNAARISVQLAQSSKELMPDCLPQQQFSWKLESLDSPPRLQASLLKPSWEKYQMRPLAQFAYDYQVCGDAGVEDKLAEMEQQLRTLGQELADKQAQLLCNHEDAHKDGRKLTLLMAAASIGAWRLVEWLLQPSYDTASIAEVDTKNKLFPRQSVGLYVVDDLEVGRASQHTYSNDLDTSALHLACTAHRADDHIDNTALHLRLPLPSRAAARRCTWRLLQAVAKDKVTLGSYVAVYHAIPLIEDIFPRLVTRTLEPTYPRYGAILPPNASDAEEHHPTGHVIDELLRWRMSGFSDTIMGVGGTRILFNLACKVGRRGVLRQLVRGQRDRVLHLYGTSVYRGVIRTKWLAFGRAFAVIQLLLYATLASCFAAFALKGLRDLPCHGANSLVIGLLGTTSAICTLFLLREIKRIYTYGVWHTMQRNLLRVGLATLTYLLPLVIITPMALMEGKRGPSWTLICLTAAEAIMLAFQSSYYLMPFRVVGKFVGTVHKVVSRIIAFIILVVLFLIGFSVAATVLFYTPNHNKQVFTDNATLAVVQPGDLAGLRPGVQVQNATYDTEDLCPALLEREQKPDGLSADDAPSFATFADSLVTVYAGMVGYSDPLRHNINSAPRTAVFVLAELTFFIICLNLLIAVLAEIYMAVKKKEQLQSPRRSIIIDDIESWFPEHTWKRRWTFLAICMLLGALMATHILAAYVTACVEGLPFSHHECKPVWLAQIPIACLCGLLLMLRVLRPISNWVWRMLNWALSCFDNPEEGLYAQGLDTVPLSVGTLRWLPAYLMLVDNAAEVDVLDKVGYIHQSIKESIEEVSTRFTVHSEAVALSDQHYKEELAKLEGLKADLARVQLTLDTILKSAGLAAPQQDNLPPSGACSPARGPGSETTPISTPRTEETNVRMRRSPPTPAQQG